MVTPAAAAIRPWRVRRVRHGQGDVAGGERGVEAPGLGIADGVAGDGAHQRPDVPAHEHGDPGHQNASIRARRPGWAVAMAVVSSITSWAVSSLRARDRSAKVGARATP